MLQDHIQMACRILQEQLLASWRGLKLPLHELKDWVLVRYLCWDLQEESVEVSAAVGFIRGK